MSEEVATVCEDGEPEENKRDSQKLSDINNESRELTSPEEAPSRPNSNVDQYVTETNRDQIMSNSLENDELCDPDQLNVGGMNMKPVNSEEDNLHGLSIMTEVEPSSAKSQPPNSDTDVINSSLVCDIHSRGEEDPVSKVDPSRPDVLGNDHAVNGARQNPFNLTGSTAESEQPHCTNNLSKHDLPENCEFNHRKKAYELNEMRSPVFYNVGMGSVLSSFEDTESNGSEVDLNALNKSNQLSGSDVTKSISMTEQQGTTEKGVKFKSTQSSSTKTNHNYSDPWVKMNEEPEIPEDKPPPIEESVPSPAINNCEVNIALNGVRHADPEEASSCENQSLYNDFIKDIPGPCTPEDLIEGIIFTANYLGTTQLSADRNTAKNSRMIQAQEAVSRIKAPDGESQPSVEIDLFISTSKVKVLNGETQETMMDHTLRSVSYIADIGDLLIVMVKRQAPDVDKGQHSDDLMREHKPLGNHYRIICHVISSPDAHLIAQSIGQAFNVAYQQFLHSNGIEPQSLTRDDYNEILDVQEMYHDDLVHYSKQENIKEIWIEKKKGESMGIAIVESGWGSIIPTVILANLQHGSPVERNGKLSIGDQLMSINSTSLVGLPLPTCQNVIKGLRNQTLVKMNIVSCPPVVTVLIKRPDLKYQLGFSVQNGIICSLMRGGIAERGGVRVGHRLIEINNQSVVATPHERIVQMLVTSVGEIHMKTMPAAMYRILTGQEQPVYL